MNSSKYPEDQILIDGIRDYSNEAIIELYNRHRDYCIKFICSKTNDDNLIEDIFHDAIIAFIENVRHKNLLLNNASIQTYLNSICYHQLLNKNNLNNRPNLLLDDYDLLNEYDESINDWLVELNNLNEERVKIISEELEKLETSGPKCHELLKKFYLENKTIEEITNLLKYPNANSAKTQKYKCKERLRKNVLDRLKLIK